MRLARRRTHLCAVLPLGCRLFDHFGQVVHAGDVAGDKLLVVRLPFKDLVDDGQVQCIIAVGTHLPVAGGFGSREAGTGIDVGVTRRPPDTAAVKALASLTLIDSIRFRP